MCLTLPWNHISAGLQGVGVGRLTFVLTVPLLEKAVLPLSSESAWHFLYASLVHLCRQEGDERVS